MVRLIKVATEQRPDRRRPWRGFRCAGRRVVRLSAVCLLAVCGCSLLIGQAGAASKIEGYFDLCHLKGLTGDQGVLIPTRNVPHLMLRKDLIAEVEAGRFHIWAVSTIEEGLEVLTGQAAGERQADGNYPPETLFGKVDAELTRLAEEVARYGAADVARSD